MTDLQMRASVFVERWDTAAKNQANVQARRKCWEVLYCLDKIIAGLPVDTSKAMAALDSFRQTEDVLLVRCVICGAIKN